MSESRDIACHLGLQELRAIGTGEFQPAHLIEIHLEIDIGTCALWGADVFSQGRSLLQTGLACLSQCAFPRHPESGRLDAFNRGCGSRRRRAS